MTDYARDRQHLLQNSSHQKPELGPTQIFNLIENLDYPKLLFISHMFRIYSYTYWNVSGSGLSLHKWYGFWQAVCTDRYFNRFRKSNQFSNYSPSTWSYIQIFWMVLWHLLVNILMDSTDVVSSSLSFELTTAYFSESLQPNTSFGFLQIKLCVGKPWRWYSNIYQFCPL